MAWRGTSESGRVAIHCDRASGRLTRSARRHGGTESGCEVGLRAICPRSRHRSLVCWILWMAWRAKYPRRPRRGTSESGRVAIHCDRASGWLTRSARRHGGTESGFEVGLHAISSTFCPQGRGSFTTEYTEMPFGRHGRRPGKECAPRDSVAFHILIRHGVTEMCASQL